MKLTTVDGSGAKRVISIQTPQVHRPTVFMPDSIPLMSPEQVRRIQSILPRPQEPQPDE